MKLPSRDTHIVCNLLVLLFGKHERGENLVLTIGQAAFACEQVHALFSRKCRFLFRQLGTFGAAFLKHEEATLHHCEHHHSKQY